MKFCVSAKYAYLHLQCYCILTNFTIWDSLIFQFTLYCKLKGNKPDFHLAMTPELSEKMYGDFINQLKSSYSPDLVKGTCSLCLKNFTL